jgi:hypothetical protein
VEQIVIAWLAMVALGVEVGPLQEVSTTPGLTRKEVVSVIEPRLANLKRCARLVFETTSPQGRWSFRPLELSPDADDRLTLEFEIAPTGKVADRSLEVRSLFAEDGCVQADVATWVFPSFQSKKNVRVSVLLTFRVTADERKQQLGACQEALRASCKLLSTKPDQVNAARKPPVSCPRLFMGLETFPERDFPIVLQDLARSYALGEDFCPGLEKRP